MDISYIKSTYYIVDVIGQHISGGLKRQGTQYVGNCPFHDDHHASLKVSESKNRFKCFVTSCGKGGDMFDFFTLQGKTVHEAANIITGGGTIAPPAVKRKTEPVKKWISAVPNQTNLPNPLNVSHYSYESKPVAAWAYHNSNGNIIGFVCRFELKDGKKDVLPYSFKQQIDENAQPLGNAVWRWMEIDKPRPLYDLHLIEQNLEKIILVVEGEKTAEAAKQLFPQYVVTTWIGGSDNVKYTDWTPLKDRNVYMWPDNDIPGLHAMFGGWSLNEKTGIYTRITGISELVKANFKRIKNQQSFPKKWDVADADWTPDEAFQYLKENRDSIPLVSETPPNELPITAVTIPPPPLPVVIPEHNEIHIPPAVPAITSKTEVDEEPANPYFKCLGFENNDQNLYIFFVYRTNVIVKLSAGGISTSNLLQLAPLNYWEGHFPKNGRSGGVKFEINQIADYLINVCGKLGIFNPNKIRGRGAWIDNGVPVIHCGDKLIVNGVETPFNKHRSKFIYEAGQELGFSLSEPLKKTDAYKLIQMLERLNWARDIDARLIAGWIVIATLCGALNWRSHLWLTGSSGSGKSEIMKKFIKTFLGQMLVDAQGATTEAGIRQYLKADALPVVFDEAEAEDRKSAERMQSVLEIMRASSTSDGGKIFKGSAGGAAAQFNIRSCFAFASIGANLTQRSDISRITVIEIKKDDSPNAKEKWHETLDMYGKTVTDEFVQAFQSRAVMMLPTILKNAAVFSNAAAAELDNQRTGDQLGALLAGAYSLTSDNVISFEDAKKWIKERDWSEERLQESTRDEIKVVNKIMDAEAHVETTVGIKTRTIGELIVISRGDTVSEYESGLIPVDLAKMTLRRLGMKVEDRFVIFSDNSEFISKALTDTAYRKNYHTILSRVDGAEKVDPTTFASGIKSRAVKISTETIFGEYKNPGIKSNEKPLTVAVNEVQTELFK